MTLQSSPRQRRRASQPDRASDETVIAIDVETTGLDPQADRIIEVAAVKFRGAETLDEFTSLANPGVRLSPFITDLTGITQADVDAAPLFSELATRLREFIGADAVAGHNVSFDTSFLRTHGVPVRGAAYDTRDLAFVLLTGEMEYGLERLSTRLGLGHDRPHRALYDARATRDLFLLLRERMARLDPATLDRLRQVSVTPGWPVGMLAGRLLAAMPPPRNGAPAGTLGLDVAAVARRARPAWGSRPARTPEDGASLTGAVQAAFAEGGTLQGNMPGYEPRPQQAQMAAAVASAIAEGAHTVIEAGTGVGKTLAYLVPAALHASSGGKPVIVSTNTINLQEQLLGKDLPVARGVMEGLRQQTTGPTELRAAQLKGRANYICFKKWAYAAQSGAAADIDARVVAKCLIWLQETETGDRAEIGLGREGAAFARLSAQGAKGCPSPDGPCFLRKARSEAQGADIIVINHSLLLSEVAHDAGLLPEHDALIIDEAHHLEAVATRHLGFDVTEPQLGADLAPLQGERGLIMQLAQVCQSLGAARALNLAPAAAAAALTGAARASERAGEFFGALRAFATNHAMPGEERADLRLTPGLRAQPDWSGVEVAWENLDAPLAETLSGLQALVTQAESSAPLNPDAQAVLLNVSTAADALLKGRAGLRQAVAEPSKDMIYWAELAERGAGSQARRWVSVHGAPLRVGPILAEKLFKRERCVVMTGATLSSDRAVDRLRTAVGLESSRDLLLGSPFDYRSAALIVVPEDIPEPGAAGYAKAVASAISGIGLALRDRTLVLFTSNSAMETARKAVAPGLQREGVRVVAQGVDGPPHRIMRSLAETQACIAMGAASLWEGVDINSGAGNGPGSDREAGANLSIRALVMPRLPFPVPTDPIFAARSELYEDSFNDYAVPEAVLRFRQGFGRLIRSKSDRGAFVVLDRRILTKQYGIEFQRALPKCTVRRVSLGDLGATVARWNMGEEV